MRSAMSVREIEHSVEPQKTLSEPSVMYREAFMRATAHLGMTREKATSMVQAVSGRRFDDCGWPELEPVVQKLRLLLEGLLTSPPNRRNECGK